MEISNNTIIPISNTRKNEYIYIPWIEFIVFPLIVVSGLIGNTLTISVMTMPRNQHSSTLFLFCALGIADLLCTIVNLAGTVMMFLMSFGINVSNFINIFCKYFVSTHHYLFNLSSFFLSGVSIERCLVTTFPLKALQICTRKNAKIFCIIGMIFFILIDWHKYWLFESLPPDPNNVLIAVSCAYAKSTKSTKSTPKLAVSSLRLYHLLSSSVIPFVLLLICNIITVYQVSRKSDIRKSQNAEDRRKDVQKKTFIRMTLLVSTVFILLTGPFTMYRSVLSIDPSIGKNLSAANYLLVMKILQKIWLLNTSVNFYLYLLGGGRKFRNDLFALFKKSNH